MNIEQLNDQVTKGEPVEIKHDDRIITIINQSLIEAIRFWYMPTESSRTKQLERTKLTCKTITP